MIPIFSLGQNGGRYYYEFLNPTSYSPRVAAMGGDFLAVKDGDVGLALSNPSIITADMNNYMALNYVNFFDGINYGYASFGKTLEKYGSFVASAQFMSYGNFKHYDESGEYLGEFYAGDAALNIGWGRALSERFSIGANFKMISSFYESYSSYGLGVDLAATYFVEENDLSSSLIVKNIGRPVKVYGDVSGPLPFEIQLGVSKKVEHLPFRYSILFNHLEKWDLRYDDPDEVNYDPISGEIVEDTKLEKFADNLARHVVVGGEFTIAKSFYLRGGFNYKRRQELKVNSKTALTGFSVGFGLRVKKFHFSYARSAYHLAGSPHYISITTRLSDLFVNKEKEIEL